MNEIFNPELANYLDGLSKDYSEIGHFTQSKALARAAHTARTQRIITREWLIELASEGHISSLDVDLFAPL